MKKHSNRLARNSGFALTLALAAGVCLLVFRLPSVAQVGSAVDQGQRPAIELTSKLPFGVYDPHGTFSHKGSVAIEHVFLPWQDVDLQSLRVADDYAAERGRELLITVEPWSWSSEKRISRDALADGILAGQFDSNINNICRTAAQLKSRVTIRWGHEMDDTSGRYTWSLWKPETYVRAYRHFVDLCRVQSPDASFMWSPKGETNLNAFYPGADHVDVIGLSVFGLQEYDVEKLGRNGTFEEALHKGYDRVVGYEKPIFVAELGFVGDGKYIEQWVKGVNAANQNFPDLRAILYFNEIETHPWPDNHGRPDWRIPPALVK